MSDFFIRFVNGNLLYCIIPLYVCVLAGRYFFHKPVYYLTGLTPLFKPNTSQTNRLFALLPGALRALALALLAILVAQPQLVDKRSEITIDGIDIVLVLDVSGSMNLNDYGDKGRSRIDVAKQEAIRFVGMRAHDAIGLVIFGSDALSRCPITSDRIILKKMITELKIGMIEPNGTVLARGIITAANRLKNSKAKSKIMIVLTDGEPTEHDLSPDVAIKIAKELGIKIYTIGIGSDEVRYAMFAHGLGSIPGVNKELLSYVASETGGKFFMAHNANDMRSIYQTIDGLERTRHDVPMFSNYFELITPLGCAALALLLLELICTALFWVFA